MGYSIVLGEHDMKTSIADGQKQTATIKQIFIHPGYDHQSPAKLNDIALIRLNRAAEWSEFVQPACLPPADGNLFSGVLATVSGWGKTELGKSQFKIPRSHRLALS